MCAIPATMREQLLCHTQLCTWAATFLHFSLLRFLALCLVGGHELSLLARVDRGEVIELHSEFTLSLCGLPVEWKKTDAL